MDDLKQFQSKLSVHKVAPPTTAWSSIENKLDHRRRRISSRRSKVRKFILGIAACSVMVILVRVSQINSQEPVLRHGQVASWENLEFHESDHQVIENTKGLNKAYSSLFERRSR